MSASPMTPHLVVMAAGTGGHIVPGIAVAQEMQRRGWTVSWIGTAHGMENRLVPKAQLPLEPIAFSGLRGKGVGGAIKGAFRLWVALLECAAILRRRRASAVLGMGGYVCLPGGVAAWLQRRPLMLVNADAAWLLSNRVLLPLARRVAFGFEGRAARGCRRAVVTGNPVRADIEALPEPQHRYAHRDGVLRLLVVGGSLGARILNEVVPQAVALLPVAQRPAIVHQTGQHAADAVRAAYEGLEFPGSATVDVRPFIDNMAAALADCDLVICRAGAITISELCAAGVAGLLVPLVLSTTSHQRDNAHWMTQAGAASVVEQDQFRPETLAQRLAALTRGELQAQAERARALARPHAAARVADELERLVRA